MPVPSRMYRSRHGHLPREDLDALLQAHLFASPNIGSSSDTTCCVAAIMEAMSAGCEIVVASQQHDNGGALRETLQGLGGTYPFITEDWTTKHGMAC
mmetsp:Transcript_25409/g.27254  ORF Transcript_25409/g.27254 Transcript_25409/m.27254 type:complete len:97 (+) Transcript_25409:358-648(+)